MKFFFEIWSLKAFCWKWWWFKRYGGRRVLMRNFYAADRYSHQQKVGLWENVDSWSYYHTNEAQLHILRWYRVVSAITRYSPLFGSTCVRLWGRRENEKKTQANVTFHPCVIWTFACIRRLRFWPNRFSRDQRNCIRFNLLHSLIFTLWQVLPRPSSCCKLRLHLFDLFWLCYGRFVVQ
jgi:hypothetical protein